MVLPVFLRHCILCMLLIDTSMTMATPTASVFIHLFHCVLYTQLYFPDPDKACSETDP